MQGNSGTPQSTAASSVAVTFTAAQSQGNLNVVIVGWNNGASPISSVTDSKGNAYQRAVGPTTAGGSFSQSIYYAKNIAAAAAGANVVTVSFSPAAPYPDVRILEYSGVDPSTALDAVASGTGNSATSSTTSLTTSAANALLVAGNYVATSTSAAGTGFTRRMITNPDGDIAEDRVAATAGSYSATASLAGAGSWVMQMVAFRAAGGAPDTTPPSVPGGLSATAASASEIDLAWSASSDNVGVTSYSVESCAGAGCTGFAQIGTSTGTTFSNTGLAAGTSYSYRVRAADAAGNLSGYSNTASATTLSPDTQPPTVPANLIASGSGGQVSLSWTASTDNVGVVSYPLERCQGAGCTGFTQVAAPAGTSFTDTPPGAGTWVYRVRATDAAGNLSGYSNTASATTVVPATPRYVQGNAATPQSAQTTVAVAYTAAQQAGDLNVVIVGWDDAASVVSAVTDSAGNSYQPAGAPAVRAGSMSLSIYYGANIAAAAANTVTVRFSQAAAYPDIRILEYSGIVASAALDASAAGNGNNATSSTSALTTSAGSDLLVAGNYVATLTSGPGSGFTSRMITSPDGDIVEDRVAATAGSYSASAPLAGAGDWVMQMAAFRAAGGAPDTTPPTAPSGLSATAMSTSQVDLAWTASTDNLGVASYSIESCAGAACTAFAPIGTSTSTVFSNTGLAAGTSYSYRVRAADAAGNLSGYSNVATAVTPAPDTQPPTAPASLTANASGSQVSLSWAASTDNVGVTAYLLERCQGAGCTAFAQIAAPSATSYSDSPGAADSYSYRVRATDGAGNLSDYSSTASATTTGTPAAPKYIQGTAATPQTSQSTVALAYTAPQQGGDLNVVIIGWNDATTAVSSVTDSAGNAYAAAGPTVLGASMSQSIYYAANVAAAAANTVTVRFSKSAPYADVRILEYSGIAASAPLDAVAGASGSSSLSSSGNATLAGYDLIVAGNYVATITSGPGSGFTSRMITSPDGDIVEDRVVNGGTQSASAPLGAPGEWVMQMAAFKAGGTAPPPDTTPPVISIASPPGGSTLTGSATVSATASDDSGVVVGAQLLVDGVPVGTPLMAAPWTFRLDTTKLANGNHSLSATAWDPSRNVGTSAAVPVVFANASAGNPAQTGLWSGTLPLPIVTVHQSLLPGGRVLMYDGQSFGSDARVWDTVTNTFVSVPVPANTFCTGHEQLADGRILVAGGHAGAHIGLTFAGAFDPVSQSWTVLTDMAYQRWYPTVTALSDGRALVLAGESTCAECEVLIPEIYDPAANTWTRLSGSSFSFPYYPHVFLLPNGKVMVSSTSEDPIVSQTLDLASGAWSSVGGPAVDGASAAMYLPGKIVKSGTSCDPDQPSRSATATTYVLDATQPSPAWRQVAAMNYARAFHTLTSLPDGTVLATGGGPTTAATDTAHAILVPELWSPAAETWTTLAPMTAPRLYHSEAMLLPDGRVMVSGGGRFDDTTLPTDQFSAEFFSPPYLFKGSRPVIASAPAVLQYGRTFTVQTPDAANIAAVSLIRYGSVTHAINMGQRFVPLTFTAGAGTLTVTAPVDGRTAPPGNYLLFIVNGSGVPSVAATVRF